MKKTLLALAMSSITLFAANHVVDQKDKTFIPHAITVKAGDTITFKNSDPFTPGFAPTSKMSFGIIKRIKRSIKNFGMIVWHWQNGTAISFPWSLLSSWKKKQPFVLALPT